MTIPDDQPAAGRRRVRPYAMTGGRTRPTHTDLEIEALVATTAIGQQTPKLTVEQRDIAALCHDILSIAEISARLHLPLGSSVSWLVTWPTSAWSWSTGPPRGGRPSRPGAAGAGAVRAACHLTVACYSRPRICHQIPRELRP